MSDVVEEGRLGGLGTIRLQDPASGASAVVALRGATLLQWFPAVEHNGDHVDGYRDEQELIDQAGVRNGLMAPFSNRIRGGRYTFDGERHDLLPGVPEAERLVYHGFLRLLDCPVIDSSVPEGGGARVRLSTSGVRPGAFPGYPFAVDLEVAYTLTARELTLEIIGRNVGDRVAPYGCGWHPYFRLGTRDVDPLELQVPARTAVRTDPDLIPLDGAAAIVPVAAGDGPDFSARRPIGDAVIDGAYGDLVPDPDGVVRTGLHDPRTGRSLTVWQRGGLMHAFTGDTLDREPRTSVALEPVELMTDAFNRPDHREQLALEPGAERSFVCGVSVSE
jgi:aldose 1-epimerase